MSAPLGFQLRCLKCGEPNGMCVYLDDLETVRCAHCDQEYTLSEVRQTVEEWALVLAWRDLAPPRQGAAPALRPAHVGG
jgi:ribose 5-phosphate isomerase RpiB